MKLWNLIKVSPWASLGVAVGVGLCALAIFLFFRNLDRAHQRAEDNLRNQGAIEERADQQGEILNVVRNAQRPATGDELNVVCSKYDRNCPAPQHP